MRDEGRGMKVEPSLKENGAPKRAVSICYASQSRVSSHAPSVTLLDLGFGPKVGYDLLNHLPLHELL